MKRWIEPLARPVIRYATRSYIAGEAVGDALKLAVEARASGFACTLCYWNDGKESPETVATHYRATIDAIHGAGLDGKLAIKTPALWDRADLAASVVRYARERQIRVMFDSHAPAQSDDIFRTIDICGPEGVGIAIPGRWRRSIADAERAISLGLDVRVVKGQWADPDDPGHDLSEGYRRIIDLLAGRARKVAVATHDPELSEAALSRLTAAETHCEQELIYPDPLTRTVEVADRLKVGSRLYIPFGSAWLPYSLSRAARKPEVLVWLIRDIFVPGRFKMPARQKETCETAHFDPLKQ